MLVVGFDGDCGRVNVWKRERFDWRLMAPSMMWFLNLNSVSGLQGQRGLRKYQSGK